MKIDQKTFERVVSSATNGSNAVFDKIEPNFNVVEQHLKNELLGPMADNMDSVPNLSAVVTRLVCLRAYYEQVPQLDLILTPTGFGIVSNQNLAPASADRVKNLREQLKQAYEDDFDHAIEMLIGTDWADSPQARMVVPHLIYTAKILRQYVDKPNAHRSDLEAVNSKIYVAEEKLREHVSSEFFDSLLEKLRKYQLSKHEAHVVHLCCQFIGFCVSAQYGPAKQLLARIEDYVDKNAETFEVYKNSPAYRVKHQERYQNEKEDSTYFWG